MSVAEIKTRVQLNQLSVITLKLVFKFFLNTELPTTFSLKYFYSKILMLVKKPVRNYDVKCAENRLLLVVF